MREDIKLVAPVNATPEGAALVLFQYIASTEGKCFELEDADRAWILDTYATCLKATKGQKY